MMSTSDYMVESTAYPFHLDPHHHLSVDPQRIHFEPDHHLYTENPQAFYIRQQHTENDVMEMSTLRHRNTQRFHFPYGTTDYLQQYQIFTWRNKIVQLFKSIIVFLFPPLTTLISRTTGCESLF
ncbi:hypothetical protein AVEN_170675-1 [Araneus ventricosus]|uniref:Uncharacterized protein n=1 Tax=Araneus ventricosus TaxID=182803 RepID=A0A4Y2QWA7_ARAVE|nr:hypothetical protein AVEN_50295-1 [Araneus ventricosus]GBN67651.1 hypothetical protein AVEN_151082-1 [Araneus ventricosus]GBN67653.1 hypothetical protein AVEN_151614-1 [Araneus ventricosus]GBN67671.1 hypothetical protein AVEN_170675-1 [Araneus ventricosus]